MRPILSEMALLRNYVLKMIISLFHLSVSQIDNFLERQRHTFFDKFGQMQHLRHTKFYFMWCRTSTEGWGFGKLPLEDIFISITSRIAKKVLKCIFGVFPRTLTRYQFSYFTSCGIVRMNLLFRSQSKPLTIINTHLHSPSVCIITLDRITMMSNCDY